MSSLSSMIRVAWSRRRVVTEDAANPNADVRCTAVVFGMVCTAVVLGTAVAAIGTAVRTGPEVVEDGAGSRQPHSEQNWSEGMRAWEQVGHDED